MPARSLGAGLFGRKMRTEASARGRRPETGQVPFTDRGRRRWPSQRDLKVLACQLGPQLDAGHVEVDQLAAEI